MRRNSHLSPPRTNLRVDLDGCVYAYARAPAFSTKLSQNPEVPTTMEDEEETTLVKMSPQREMKTLWTVRFL